MMKVFINVSLVVFIITSLYIVYGVWHKDLAKRNYEYSKRFFPSFLIWPKDLSNYTRIFKLLSLLLLIGFLVLYMLFITT